MSKTRKNIWMFVSIGAILLFIITFLAYMKDSHIPYPGPWPLILVSSTVIITLGTALVFSLINLFKYKFHWQAIVTIFLNAILLVPVSYAYLIWVIIMIA